MKRETMEIISICKGNSFNRQTSLSENIREFLFAKNIQSQPLHNKKLEEIIITALTDYLNCCEKSGEFMKEVYDRYNTYSNNISETTYDVHRLIVGESVAQQFKICDVIYDGHRYSSLRWLHIEKDIKNIYSEYQSNNDAVNGYDEYMTNLLLDEYLGSGLNDIKNIN